VTAEVIDDSRRSPFDFTSFEAVIFDCDGVVSDSEPASVEGWIAAVRSHGLEVDEEEMGSFIGQTERDLANHYAPRTGVTVDVMMASARSEFLEIVERNGVRAFPDAIALVGQVASSGVPFGMGSNSPRWRLDAVLSGSRMAGSFEVTVAGDEVPVPKPAPDVYLAVARRLGVAPERSVVIEDSPTGIRAARAAGCTVVAVHRGAVDRDALAIADLVVDGLWPV
jgi:HAD superfamily hydrolase (TIGR01509 family)